MSAFERALKKLDPAEAEILKRLDDRLSLAQLLLHKLVPGIDPSTPDYAKVLLDYFDCVDMAIMEEAELGLEDGFLDPDDEDHHNGDYHG